MPLSYITRPRFLQSLSFLTGERVSGHIFPSALYLLGSKMAYFGIPRRSSDQSQQAQLFLDSDRMGCLLGHISLAFTL
jgi:hypothetical protein